jgi:Protein of unknown function (DUF1761)
MDWMLLVAIAASGAVSLFTDWLFMGVLFHDRYDRYPEIWWPAFREQGDTRAIVLSSALAFVTAAAVVVLCALTGANDFRSALTVAALAWAAGPLVVVITNGFWIKIDPAVTFAHAMGYLVRFLVAGAAYVLLAA